MPRQNGYHFAADVFKCILLNGNVWVLLKISLKFVPSGSINNIPALFQIMAWHRSGNKPLSEPMIISLLTHICVARSQWVKQLCLFSKFNFCFWYCSLQMQCLCMQLVQCSSKMATILSLSQCVNKWKSYGILIPRCDKWPENVMTATLPIAGLSNTYQPITVQWSTPAWGLARCVVNQSQTYWYSYASLITAWILLNISTLSR